MNRCLELARLAAGSVAPNPMVGCVIVHQGKIIGEGFHQSRGEAHAEVNAINSVKQKELLKQSSLFVTLEPCAHHGLTPPCSDLIIKKQIPEVYIGTLDPFAEVAGKGIERLQQAGIHVETGIMEQECRKLNKTFFTYHEKKRPYVFLKWAQTLDGFIDMERVPEKFGQPTWITGDLALRLVHKIRSEQGAILVGTKTAQKDNPSLTVRHWAGNSPLRILVDKELKLEKNGLNLYDNQQKTLIFNSVKDSISGNTEFVKINFKNDLIPQILTKLYNLRILSVIVEGGKFLLDSFINADMWDEAHIFIGNKFFFNGVKAPVFKGIPDVSEELDNDWIKVFHNKH